MLAEHETVHILGRKILQVRQSGTREELHRLLGQLHGHSHRFQEGLGQAVKAMRDNAAATASRRCDRDVGIQESGKKLQID
ncbi:hypothetical protein BBC27_06095 [Acidithiobacillus ferrivorans]|uniref:Uncharacterized protein n=1 Tax=Acidithiobacillus ferrivorans TaxID=160808 RepID=A0A1B9C1R6_9PROT|nr:hypothetical protein BBC27_06095 [Acidithiobacillus ferrivorans]